MLGVLQKLFHENSFLWWWGDLLDRADVIGGGNGCSEAMIGYRANLPKGGDVAVHWNQGEN